jgi:hypothetical protein
MLEDKTRTLAYRDFMDGRVPHVQALQIESRRINVQRSLFDMHVKDCCGMCASRTHEM